MKKTVFFPLLILISFCILIIFLSARPVQAKVRAPKAPDITSVDWVSDQQLSIRWTRTGHADGYILYSADSEDDPPQKLAVFRGSSSVRAIISARKKQIRYFSVKAYTLRKNQKIKSERSEAFANTTYFDSPLGELFPKGVPKTEHKMEAYLTYVRVPVYAGGHSRTMTLLVHKKLKKKIRAAFLEMYKLRFPVKRGATGSYNWRRMSTSKLRSHHSYGCAIDINWDDNPMVTLSQIRHCCFRPGKNRYCITKKVRKIWESHGFHWGGDWTEKKDYMHFSYTNC